MNSPEAKSFDLFPPELVIELGSMGELDQFEDLFAAEMPEGWWQHGPMGPHDSAWTSRVRLSAVIRPPKFNGRISDIKLRVMTDPSADFIEANSNHRLYSRSYRQRRTALYSDMHLLHGELFGFDFVADAYSSGRGKVGEIQSQLFYAPYREDRDRAYGEPLFRCVAVPQFEKEKFVKLQETATRIGFMSLRQAMSHPLPGGLPGTANR